MPAPMTITFFFAPAVWAIVEFAKLAMAVPPIRSMSRRFIACLQTDASRIPPPRNPRSCQQAV